MKKVTEKIENENTGNGLCSIFPKTESDIDNYIKNINNFRINSENKYNSDLEFYTSLIKSNGENINKSLDEIEQEISDYKSIAKVTHQYDVDFANNMEFEISQYLSKHDSLEELYKNLCNICRKYGYFSPTNNSCN